MKIENFRFNFTGNWAYVPKVIEIVDVQFCKNLFDKPDLTITGFAGVNSPGIYGTDSFFISLMPFGTSDVVIINSTQLSISANKLETLLTAIQLLKEKIIEINGGSFQFAFLNFTIAIDAEVDEYLNNKLKVATEWLSEKFIANSFSFIEEFKDSQLATYDINFNILKPDGNVVTFIIQPRNQAPEKIYVRVSEDFKSGDDNIISSVGKRISTLDDILRRQVEKIVNDGD